MAQKMVTSFRRSLSFPNPPSHTSSSKPRKTLHVRSASLPCRSHPLISHLRDDISLLTSWSTCSPRTSSWLCTGLRRLKSLHDSLDDLLHLPQTRDSLATYPHPIEKFLDDFLRLVDVYGTFQTLALRLKEEFSSAQIAIRRRDESDISIRMKSVCRVAKEIGKLGSSLVPIGKSCGAPVQGAPHDDEAEVVGVISDVLKATVSVSVLVFVGISISGAFRKGRCLSFGVKSKSGRVEGGIREFEEIVSVKMETKKMHEMEDRILEIEECGERAFRSLINTRVSLLNVVTQ